MIRLIIQILSCYHPSNWKNRKDGLAYELNNSKSEIYERPQLQKP